MTDYDKPAKGIRQHDGISVTVRKSDDDMRFHVDKVGGMMLMEGYWNEETKERLCGSVDGATATCAAITNMLEEAASDFEPTVAERAADIMGECINGCDFTPNVASGDAESLQFVDAEPDDGAESFHLDSVTMDSLNDEGIDVEAFSVTSTGARIWFKSTE